MAHLSFIEKAYECISLNGCLGMAAFIILQKFRWSMEGKFCSNDLNSVIVNEKDFLL